MHELSAFQYIIFLSITVSLVLLVLIQYGFLAEYMGWNVIYADNGYNPRLVNLSSYLASGKWRVIEERLSNHNYNPRVSLADLGLRHDAAAPGRSGPGNHSEYVDLFEKFIDANPQLPAFRQYYFMENNGNTIRNLSRVIISPELITAIATCTNHSI